MFIQTVLYEEQELSVTNMQLLLRQYSKIAEENKQFCIYPTFLDWMTSQNIRRC